MRVKDPNQLSRDELVAEWGIREEELQMQNEMLKESQSRAERVLYRYEMIFSYSPLPIVIIDSHLAIREINMAAENFFPQAATSKGFFFPRLLSDSSKRTLDNLIQQSITDSSSAQEFHFEFRNTSETANGIMIVIDRTGDEFTYALMMNLEEA